VAIKTAREVALHRAFAAQPAVRATASRVTQDDSFMVALAP